MSAFLLDTDVLSNTRKNKPHPQLVEWLAHRAQDELHLSIITIFELQVGANIVRASDANKADEIDRWIDGLIETGDLLILSMDASVTRLYAEMFTTPDLKNFLVTEPKSKKLKSGADLILAATAIVHDLTIATNNAKDFLKIHDHFPLPGLYLPFTDEWVVARGSTPPPP